MARRHARAEVVTIFWRDIPAQVNAQLDRRRHQVVLSERFHRSIDRAKRKARIVTAADDVAQWRRETTIVGDRFDDAIAAAESEAHRLETMFTPERLGRLAYVGGWESSLTADEMIHHDHHQRGAV